MGFKPAQNQEKRLKKDKKRLIKVEGLWGF